MGESTLSVGKLRRAILKQLKNMDLYNFEKCGVGVGGERKQNKRPPEDLEIEREKIHKPSKGINKNVQDVLENH